ILLIAIAAVLSGAESWNDIADYGEAKLEWLKTFLSLPSGIPSHDTFNRVFAALDPEEMEKGFVTWVSSIARLTAGEVVAIDGKALCGTRETGNLTLAAHGIDGHHGSGQFQCVQQLRNGRNLVGFFIDLALRQHQAIALGPGRNHVDQSLLSGLTCATQGLPVDGHHFARRQPGNRRNPGYEALFHLFRVQRRKHPVEGVVG